MHYNAKSTAKSKIKKVIIDAINNAQLKNFGVVNLEFQTIIGTNEIKRNNTKRDVINNAPTIKFVEDLLVDLCIIEDDRPDFVKKHIIHAERIDREVSGIGIIVKISEVENYNDNSLVEYFNKEIKKDHIFIDSNPEKTKKEKRKQKGLDAKEEIDKEESTIYDRLSIYDDEYYC